MIKFSQFIESLARLYKFNKVKKDYLNQLLVDGKIKQDEYDYIVSQIDKK